MIFTEDYRVRISDYDRSGKLSYESVLQILENVGSHNSDSVGNNVIEGSQSGIAWILAGWRIKILRNVDSREELKISTWTHGKPNATMVYRDFILADKNGLEAIKAEAKFVLLDVSAGKLTRINDELFSSYLPEERTVFDTPSPKPREPLKFDFEKVIPLRKSDIDFNGHLHNTRYVDFAAEVLPEETDSAQRINEFIVVYKKSVAKNSQVTVKRTDTETGYTVCVYGDGELCSVIEFRFLPISTK